MSDPDHADPLGLAVAVFERWREQRASAGTRVPLPLRQIACRLLDVEPRAVVAHSLQVAEATLGRWQSRGDGQRRLEPADESHHATRTDDNDGASPPITFVPLPRANERVGASAPPSPSTPFTSLVIERPDGVRLHLGGPLDIVTVAALLAPEASR